METKADITFVKKNTIRVIYFHEKYNKKIYKLRRLYNIPKIETLRTKKKWDIVYSKYSPKMMSIIDIDSKPRLLGNLTIIIIFFIPIFFIKKIMRST